ncbi:MFS general substrate transporter [Thelephora ganbajun]|uniref:MFS general substrate transporter n=1 Tax=Thelephora ganbajun TaxID=370292 RepID=A0ACB6ZF87_THEGA|nr:MFS general substrate transporter [Thelephora ganbajun]
MHTTSVSSASLITLQDDSSVEGIPVDESTALLSNVDQNVVEGQVSKPVKMTPIPKLQLATICLVRLLEPIGFTQLFPYINEMVVNLNMIDDPSKVGFISGLVESVFAIFQLISIYHWAKISDVVGRRPIVLLGAIGMGLMTFLFGFSRNLTYMLITRSIHGFFAGNIAVVHSVLGELSDPTNQAVILPIYALCWPLGVIIGPMLGGTFSNPADKFPLLDVPLLRQYPYAMPCLASAAFSAFGATLAYFLMEETLPSKAKQAPKPSKKAKSYGSVPFPPTAASLSARELFAIPFLQSLIVSGFALSFISAAFDAIFVLFAYTPIEVGGLAFSASQIGYSLSIAGCLSCFIQLFITPILLRRFSCAKMYHVCMSFWFLPFVVLPFLNLILRNGRDESGEILPHARAMVWSGIILVMLVCRLTCLAYSFSMVLAKEGAPNPSSLGATNGLVQMSMSLARTFSPAFSSSTFAASIDSNILGGHLWVMVLAGIACLGSLASARIVNESSAKKY